jgi:large subunit ribosomal protein L10
MDNPRSEKVAVVTEVRERLSSTQAALLADYRGLTVKDLSALRQSLAGAGATVSIYKNTLVRFAARELGITDLEPLLTGPTAITFVEGDAAAAAKALRDFSRTNPLLVVKGGLLGDKVVDAAGAKALADLPSREVLLSQIAGLLQAPLQQMANLLEAVPRSLAYGLMALIEKQGGAPETSDHAAPEAAPAEDAASQSAGPSSPDDPGPEPSAEAPVASDDAPAEALVADTTETPDTPESPDTPASPDTTTQES